MLGMKMKMTALRAYELRLVPPTIRLDGGSAAMAPQGRHRWTLIALAVLAAFAPVGSAWSEDNKPATSNVQSSVTVGVGGLTGGDADRALFGQYSGLRTQDLVGLLGFDYLRLSPSGGVTTLFTATDLLLETRELNLLWQRQGNWKLNAGYGELVRREPNTINTGMGDPGATTPQVFPLAGGPGTGPFDVDLKTKRKNFGLGLTKFFGTAWQADVTLNTEKKEGARLFGIGFNCPSTAAPGCAPTTGTEVGWGVLLLPEPIDAHHTQVEARLTFAADKLRLSGGYYGSFYRNSVTTLNPTVPASLYNAVGTLTPTSTGLQAILNQPVALPPDNDAHQFDLAGVYAFTQFTRLNFKVARAQVMQDQNFATSGLTGAPAGSADLDARLITTSALVGLTARPLPKLTVLGNVQYRDRDDRTPVVAYNVEGTSTYTNRRYPETRLNGKLQANYQFTPAYRGTVAANYEEIDRGEFTQTSAIAGTTALRLQTEEVGGRVELRARVLESLSAGIGAETSKRDGSNWLRDNSGLGVTEIADPSDPSVGFATGIFIPTLADRRRDKGKVSVDWQPLDALSLQLTAAVGRDKYTPPSQYGLRNTRMSQYGLDWDYTITDAWRVNGYFSYGQQKLLQSRPNEVILSFDNKTTGTGVGVTGKLLGKIDVGASASYIEDESIYAQALEPTSNAGNFALLAATGGLPDIVFRQTRISLFGQYELTKTSQIRLTTVYQRSSWNDWTWNYNGVPFFYSDGTTVSQKPEQEVVFLGVAYVYRWR